MRRKYAVVSIALAVGLLHFVTGPGYQGPFPLFVNGYLIDILAPMASYLVLGVADITPLRGGPARALLVFAIGAASETLQYFGVELFGRTFDPLDYVMFVIGILVAVLLEKTVLSRLSLVER